MTATDLILQETFDCIFRIDKNHLVTFWNKSMQALLGTNETNALNKNIFELFPSLREECYYYLDQAVIQENRSIDLPLLKLYKPVSGQEVVTRARFIPILDQGKVVGATGILGAYESHQTNESFFRNLLQSVVMNTNDAILITRAEPIDPPKGPKIIFANPAFTRMSGYSEREILGHTPRYLQGPGTSSQTKETIRRGLSNWESINCEILNYHKSGEPFWVDLGIVPVKNDEGFYTHWIAVQRDVTEKRKNMEKLENTNAYLEQQVQQRTADLESFSYFLGHDARQPMRTILSFSQLLQKELDSWGKSSEYLGYIKEAGKYLCDLVQSLEQLTLFSKEPVNKKSINLSLVLEKEIQSLQSTYDLTNLQTEISPAITLYGDHRLIQNLMGNILSNSFKYHRKGIPLILQIQKYTENNYDVVEMQDNGIGFDSTEIDSFKLFERGRTQADRPGFGIGLAICQKIVKRHGGHISIQSKPDEGTLVQIKLPKNYS